MLNKHKERLGERRTVMASTSVALVTPVSVAISSSNRVLSIGKSRHSRGLFIGFAQKPALLRSPEFSSLNPSKPQLRHTLHRHRQFLVFVSQEQQRAAPESEAEETNGTAKAEPEVELLTSEMAEDSENDDKSLTLTEALLKRYRRALSTNDEATILDVHAQITAIHAEKDTLSVRTATLHEEVALGKERILRLNADFDNFRKRSQKEKLDLANSVRGDVIETLLPMVDNFERAKAAIKTETEKEKKIDSSYQSIYKQFVEIMRGFGVSVVETVGKKFDPELHEAIMREESTRFPEGIVSHEFRRGFKLGHKLLRPATVKVSSGPPASVSEAGPALDEPSPSPRTEIPIEESKSDAE